MITNCVLYFLENTVLFKKKTGLRNIDSGGSVSLEFRQGTASTAPSDRLMATKVTLINKKHRQAY